MTTSQILGLLLLLVGFGVRIFSSVLNRFLKLEDRGISVNALRLSGAIATVAGFLFFFFLNF